jgi:hypothetical protein
LKGLFLSDFDFGTGSGSSEFVVTPTYSSSYERPPYYLLFLGMSLPAVAWLLSFFLAPPTGSNTIFIGFLFWLLSMLSYLIPFSIFTVKDLAKQANMNYLANDKKSHKFRVLVLISGSFFLIFPTYYLASSLASWVASILG